MSLFVRKYRNGASVDIVDEYKIQNVDVNFSRHGDFTVATANLEYHSDNKFVYASAKGCSKKHPDDRSNKSIGERLALARSLKALAKQIEFEAYEEIHDRCSKVNPLAKKTYKDFYEITTAISEEVCRRKELRKAKEARKQSALKSLVTK